MYKSSSLFASFLIEFPNWICYVSELSFYSSCLRWLVPVFVTVDSTVERCRCCPVGQRLLGDPTILLMYPSNAISWMWLLESSRNTQRIFSSFFSSFFSSRFSVVRWCCLSSEMSIRRAIRCADGLIRFNLPALVQTRCLTWIGFNRLKLAFGFFSSPSQRSLYNFCRHNSCSLLPIYSDLLIASCSRCSLVLRMERERRFGSSIFKSNSSLSLV